jgi:hypothetical protein
MALAGLAGCDRRSASGRGVEESATQLVGVTGGAPVAPTQAHATEKYTKVAQAASEASKADGLKGEQAAAALLAAHSQLGLGEAPAALAQAGERAARNQIRQIDAALSVWSLKHATAKAADAFDASAQKADIAKSRTAKDAELAIQRERRSTLSKEVEGLRAQAKSKLDAAEAQTAEYRRMMDGIEKVSAREAAPIVESANQKRRAGDGIRLEGLKLEAQADVLVPQVAEIDAIIAQLENQKKDLDAIEARLVERAADSAKEAQESRQAASAAATDLDALVSALAAMRETDIAPQYQAALSRFSEATKFASQAAASIPGAGKLAQGEAQLSIAEMQWSRSQGLRSYAELLATLSKIEPALPKASEYGTKAEEARTQEKEALEAAAAALESAQGAFSGARITGPAKERLTEVSELIGKSVEVARGGTMDLAATFKFQRDPLPSVEGRASGGAAPAAGGTEGEVREMIGRLLAASKSGDSAALAAMTQITDANLKKVADGQAALDAAFRAKFNTSLADAMKSNPMGAMMAGQMGGGVPGLSEDVTPESVQIAVTDDSNASLTIPGIPDAMPVKKIDGTWKLVVAMDEAMPPAMAAVLGKVGDLMQSITGKVSAGEYPDADAAVNALIGQLMPIFQGANPG